MAKIGILTVPKGNELMWTAAGIAAGFIVPAIEKKIGGDKYQGLAPEIHEAVGAATNTLIATGIGMATNGDHALQYATGSVGVAAVKTTALLVKRAQAAGATFPARRNAPSGRITSALMNEKPRMMLGAGRDSVGRTSAGGPMRLLFTVDQSGAEQLSP